MIKWLNIIPTGFILYRMYIFRRKSKHKFTIYPPRKLKFVNMRLLVDTWHFGYFQLCFKKINHGCSRFFATFAEIKNFLNNST